MTLVKKIILLIISFIVLLYFSLSEFNYDNFSSNSNENSTNNNFIVEKEEILNKVELYINKIFNLVDENKKEEPFNLVLIKKDGVVEINGLFSNENDVKKISNFLSINRQGEFRYEENRVINNELLEELVILITPFKDFFADNSKITVVNNEITLLGELKDANYKDLLDSILSRVKIDIKTQIVVPEPVKLEDLNKSIEEYSVVVERSLLKDEPKVEKVVIQEDKSYNSSSKINEVQSTINKLLSANKINFERRSTEITSSSKVVAKEIAEVLIQNPTLKIEISGHTDSRGSDSLNKKISQDRASSVRDVLISLGVNAENIVAIGYGEEFPIAQDDENGLSEVNRRVEFKVLGE